MNKQLQEALDAAIRDNTFNLSAIESIKAMRDENERLNLKVEGLELHNKELITDKSLLSAKCNEYEGKANNIKDREVAVSKREVAITQLECSVKQADAVSNAYKDCFGLVFRNQMVSSSILSSIPVANSCGSGEYLQPVTTTEQKTIS